MTKGVCVDVFLYQAFVSEYLFRFCLNIPGYTHNYVEIGDFPNDGHYIGYTINQVSGKERLRDGFPTLGQYYWIRFYFETPTTYTSYFCDRLIGEKDLGYDCSTLLNFYTHAWTHNNADILSIHITKRWLADGTTPLEGYIKQTTLNELYASNTLTVWGTYTGGTDRKLKFSVTDSKTKKKKCNI
ncbi:hypothetical protein MTO96_007194 [Rhipicephalus appendiculatus]